MKLKNFLFPVICAISLFSCTKEPSLIDMNSYNEWFSGGSTTNFNDNGSGAFAHTFKNINGEKARQHEIGDVAFSAKFQSDSNSVNYGLGPLFNHISCASCHFNDSRARAPIEGIVPASPLLLKLSLQGQNQHGGPLPIPFFGTQLQQRSIAATKAEATLIVQYIETNHTFSDGETYRLRKPVFQITNPHQPLPANYLFSPRMPLNVTGLGLLENIAEEDILQNEDISDKNQDGISGKANRVWNAETNSTTLGLFGWKAGMPTVLQQAAAAYNQDMGITNYLFPDENAREDGIQEQLTFSYKQKDLPDSILYAIGYYLKTLAIPGRRNASDENVKKGKDYFIQIGCAKCHQPFFKTKNNPALPELSNEFIFPYTDMLLHDMGEDLADNRPEFLANGNEWRTPPLWGIGLTKAVTGATDLLHDGRARNFIEAIMWHGGEANKTKQKFAELNKQERTLLIQFLESL